jgi:hypothetical protein
MRWFPTLLFILLCIGVYLAVRFVQSAPRSVISLSGNQPALPPNVNLRLTGLSLTGRKEGKVAWTMKADRLDTTRDHNELDFAGNVQAVLLEQEKPRATIKAAAAHYSNVRKLLEASGPLICILRPPSPGGEDLRIETDHVTWNVGERRVLCPGRVHAVQGDRIAEGEQLTVDLRTRNFSLRNFAVTLPVNEDVALPTAP